jgi:acyl-homoserine-lactone acylase
MSLFNTKTRRLTAVLLVIMICAATAFIILRSSGSRKDGSAVNSEILWDKWGVPHIYGEDRGSVFYAFGWAQMESHAEAILRLYGEARGRAAEYWGDEFLESDKYLRTLGLPELASKWTAAQNPENRELLESFVRGMNDYLANHSKEILDDLKTVPPVGMEDVMAHVIRTIHFTFLGMTGGKNVDKWMQAGSNGWAIGPSHSESGKAMLLANPHLGWSDRFRLYEAHLCSPGLNAYGVTFIGMPVLQIGINDNLGWTYTVNTIDAFDLYELKLKNGGYVFDERIKDFIKREDVIKIRRKDGHMVEERLPLLHSIHGPVIAAKGDKALAVRIAGLDQTGALEQCLDMATSTNINEFENALKKLQVPLFNVLYADIEGNIMYLFGGDVPVRSRGDFDYWQGIIDGTRSDTLWNRTHPYKDLPRVKNPDTGWLQNANDPPWFCTYPAVLNPNRYPAYMAPRILPFRPQRSIRMLMEDPRISYDEIERYKTSTRSELADRILDDLGAAVRTYGNRNSAEAMKVLEKWDRQYEAGSRGAVLFREWLQILGEDYFRTPWDISKPISTPAGLKDPAGAVKALDKAAESVTARFKSLDVPWGDVNRLKIADKEFPGIGGSGMLGIFHVVAYRPSETGISYAAAGETFSMITEFSDPPRAKASLVYGNSSRPGSKHIGDQLEMFSKKKYRPVLLRKDDVMKNLEKEEKF